MKTEASERVVAFGRVTATVLAEHRSRQDGEAGLAGPAWRGSGLVFTTALGEAIDPNNFRRRMDGLIALAGVPRITPKGLRHTPQAVVRVVVGDDKVMQERLSHSDVGSRWTSTPTRSRTSPVAQRTSSPHGHRVRLMLGAMAPFCGIDVHGSYPVTGELAAATWTPGEAAPDA